jgi:hypothetical protein
MQRLSTLLVLLVVVAFISATCTDHKTKLRQFKLCTSLSEEACLMDSLSFSASTHTIYCSFEIARMNRDDQVKISWYFLGDSRVLIEETSLIIPESKSSTTIHSSLNKPLNGWPKGIYELEVSLESEKPITMVKSFSINK